jgi:hypothetical protein
VVFYSNVRAENVAMLNRFSLRLLVIFVCIGSKVLLLHGCSVGSTQAENMTLTLQSVESNGCLAVKPKIPKMSYAEAARVSDVMKAQDRLIANGYDPTTSLDRLATTGPNRPKANDEKPITGLVNLDIKKK